MNALALVMVVLGASAEDRLVARVAATVAMKYPRPSHVTPTISGTFPERVVEALPLLASGASEFSGWSNAKRQACTQFSFDGGSLPEHCSALVDQVRAGAELAALATHTAEAGPLPGVRPWDDPTAKVDDPRPMVQLAARVAFWSVVEPLRTGQVDAALARCLDGLALVRDLSAGTMVLGVALSAALTQTALNFCGAVLRSLTVNRAAPACRQLETIRAGLPKFAATVRETSTSYLLLAYAPTLSPGDIRRLPAPVHAWLATKKFDPVSDALLKVELPTELTYGEEAAVAADLRNPKRDATLKALYESRQQQLNPVARTATDFARFSVVRDQVLGTFDLLHAGCLARAGTPMTAARLRELGITAAASPDGATTTWSGRWYKETWSLTLPSRAQK